MIREGGSYDEKIRSDLINYSWSLDHLNLLWVIIGVAVYACNIVFLFIAELMKWSQMMFSLKYVPHSSVINKQNSLHAPNIQNGIIATNVLMIPAIINSASMSRYCVLIVMGIMQLWKFNHMTGLTKLPGT